MTRRWNERLQCPQCGAVISTETPFDAWVRNHEQLRSEDGIVITDGDKFVHRYAVRTKGESNREVQYLMMLEVKTHGRRLEEWQRDSLHIINQLLRTVTWKRQRDGKFTPGHEQNVSTVHSSFTGRDVQMLHYGVHSLRMSGADPISSAWVKWDHQEISIDTLVKLLRFDLDPDTLRVMEHRRHKTIRTDPTLWDAS